ncbi:acyl-CoA thioesterase [Nocardioides zeae]
MGGTADGGDGREGAGTVFDCQIQARLRDINLAGHVDNVEALRIIDEARLLFLHFAPEVLPEAERPGLLGLVPEHVTELMGAQRIEYHAEMRFVAFQPFLVRLWVHRIGRSSFGLGVEMRVAADHPPALVAEHSLVLWDHEAGAAWPMSDEVRAALATYEGPGVTFRSR